MERTTPPTEDFAGRFVELFWELRERDVSKWERLVGEEMLIRSYGASPGRATVTVGRLDAMAGVLGLSRGHLRDHLVSLVQANILANDETAGRPPRVWWFKDVSMWTRGRRIEPGSDRAKRAEAGDVELCDDNLPTDERPLPGFEPKLTDPEVQADANLEHANHGSRPSLSAAASGPGSFGAVEQTRTRKGYRRTRKGYGKPVPEKGTVPESGTAAPDNAPACSARPGLPEAIPEARQPGAAVPAEKAREGMRWRALSSGEAAILHEIEDWFEDGGDPAELIAHFRSGWEGRLRRHSGFVVRMFLDAKLEVREKPDVVKKSRGGFLHTRYNDWLRAQPPPEKRLPAKVPKPAQAQVPLEPPQSHEPSVEDQAVHERFMAQMQQFKARKSRQPGGATHD